MQRCQREVVQQEAVLNNDPILELSDLLKRASAAVDLIKAEQSGKKTVSLTDYTRVIIALRRCHSLMEDTLSHLPQEKQSDMRIYLNIIRDVSSDASVLASSDFLKDASDVKPSKPSTRRRG
jgi:hypothetical protein